MEAPAAIKEKQAAVVIALALIALAVMLRLVPHPANFAPVTAVAIFGGAMLPRKLALWVPVAAMLLSDLIIGFYHIMLIIWACYALIALASSVFLLKPNLAKGIGLTLSASVFFFVVTNLAVWIFGDMYAHTLTGLTECYYMALPFFRNTLLSDLLYTGTLFGLFAVTRQATSSLLKPIRQSQ